ASWIRKRTASPSRALQKRSKEPGMTIHITNPQDGLKVLRFVADQQQRQRDAAVVETVTLVKNHAAPWPSTARDRLSLMNMGQAEQVLPHHPGHTLHVIWQSLDNLLNIFQVSCDSMGTALDDFHDQAQSASFF